MNFQPKGIIPALVTPFQEDESLDEAGLRAVVRHVLEGGVQGVFATGSQGEFYALTPDEKQRVWEVVMEEVNGRVPVYAGTGGISTRECVELTKRAASVGVDAASLITPFFIVPTPDELYTHYAAVAKAVDLPLLLYPNPTRTNVSLTTETVMRLAEIDNIVGIKDSSGNLAQTADYIDHAPEGFSVLMGNDAMIYAVLLMGGQGAIAATANVVPGLVVSIYEHFQRGDLDAAREAQRRLAPLRKAFTLSTFPVVVKEALEVLGVCRGKCRGPVGPMPAAAREKLRGIVEAMDGNTYSRTE
jgi:4-hydroxy-tetrahydrodipicolinate synthase